MEESTQQPTELQKIGRAAVGFVKDIIRHGAGNIRNAILKSEGRSYKAFLQTRKLQDDRAWRTTKKKYKIGTPELVVYRAALPTVSRGGNCEEHADLTFYYLMTQTKGLTINYAMGKDHAFIIVGDPNKDRSTWFVIDPWTTDGLVGPYLKFRAQDVQGWELKNATTGENVETLQEIYRESRDFFAKVNDNPDYPAESKKEYEERAYGNTIYNL